MNGNLPCLLEFIQACARTRWIITVKRRDVTEVSCSRPMKGDYLQPWPRRWVSRLRPRPNRRNNQQDKVLVLLQSPDPKKLVRFLHYFLIKMEIVKFKPPVGELSEGLLISETTCSTCVRTSKGRCNIVTWYVWDWNRVLHHPVKACTMHALVFWNMADCFTCLFIPLDVFYIFSLVWEHYTDGVAIFHSSQFGVWPLFLLVNELPLALRYGKYFIGFKNVKVVQFLSGIHLIP